ncbi:hypothetical protein A9I65_12100 [Staphylococcus pseudintermedius]|nr:hypothetical protein A9I66_12830 [Staphylococcus pseudintermedius]ANQ89275.1 hypothetical protein A9I65_12100 [Staphylococcus pseudintermedius]
MRQSKPKIIMGKLNKIPHQSHPKFYGLSTFANLNVKVIFTSIHDKVVGSILVESYETSAYDNAK